MSESVSTPVVVAVDEQDDLALDVGRWAALAVAAFTSQGVTAGECNLLFVDEAGSTNSMSNIARTARPTCSRFRLMG